jgi:hypothetical protein
MVINHQASVNFIGVSHEGRRVDKWPWARFKYKRENRRGKEEKIIYIIRYVPA